MNEINLQTAVVVATLALQTGAIFRAYGRLREEITELKIKVQLLIDDKIK